MAVKTANVLARVEPETKAEAEAILAQLGIPISVVINMLYKQIIMTKGIPFSLSLPNNLLARDEMSSETFHNLMKRGLEQAKNNQARPTSEIFAELRREIP